MNGDGTVHQRRFCVAVRFKVTPEQVRLADNVVIEEQQKIAACRLNAAIPGGTGAAPGLFDYAQRTGRTKFAERLGGAVGRAVHHHDDFKLIGAASAG